MENGKWETISWEDADNYLFNCLGFKVCKLSDIEAFPSNVFYTYCKIDGWEEKSDFDILMEIGVPIDTSVILYAITDVSYARNIGLFKINPSDIMDFWDCYYHAFNECFFNGDTILILPDEKKLFYFQHDGYTMKVNLPLREGI